MSSTRNSENLHIPTPEPSGFTKTLNNMGYMTSELDAVSKSFVGFAEKATQPVLDIGAAYGVATLEALKTGAQVWANDIDERHLAILANRVEPNLRKNLKTFPAEFPEKLEIKKGAVSGILIARVLHFFDGPRVLHALSWCYDALEVGGRLFVVVESPYLKNFQSFIPTFERRKREGRAWPGFIDDVMAVAPERGKFLPKQIHFFDPDTLARAATECGFKVVSSEFLNRTDFPEDLRLDGRESVGLVAEK